MHILTSTQGKKFLDMSLVKIANKGTSLINKNMKNYSEGDVNYYVTCR